MDRTLRGERKTRSIPGAAVPVLDRMNLGVENWVETVEVCGSIYHRVAGNERIFLPTGVLTVGGLSIRMPFA
jgi:hypothetical protein